METIIQIAELLGAAIAASWITRILTIRSRVRQENAGAAKAETEVKSDQIENIEKMMQKAYTPIIEGLTKQVKQLQEKVDKLETEKDEKDQRIDELEHEVRQLRAAMAMRGVFPAAVPSRRGENGKNALRNPDGTFAKKEDGNEAPR